MGYLSLTASGSFSILIFNTYDISENNVTYVYTRNVFNKFKGTENIQKQWLRSILNPNQDKKKPP